MVELWAHCMVELWAHCMVEPISSGPIAWWSLFLVGPLHGGAVGPLHGGAVGPLHGGAYF